MTEITNFEWLNDSSGSLTKITLSDQNGYYNFKENPLVLTQSMLDNGLWFRGTLNLADSLGLFEGEVTDRQSYLWESSNYTEYAYYVNFFDVVTDSNGVTLRNYIIDNELDLSSGKYSLDYIHSNYVLIRDGELYYYASNITKVEVSLDGGKTYGILYSKGGGYIARFTTDTIITDDSNGTPGDYGFVNLQDYLDIEPGYILVNSLITNFDDYTYYGGDEYSLFLGLFSGSTYTFHCALTLQGPSGYDTEVYLSITVIMNNSSDKHIRIEVTPVSDYITLEPIADGNTYSERTPLASFTSTPGFSEWGVSSPGYYFGYQLISGYWANDSQMTFNDIPEGIIVAPDDEYYSQPAIQYSNELFNDYPYGATLVLDIGVSPHCTDGYTYESNTVRVTVTALPSNEDPSTYYLVPDDLVYESGRYEYKYTPTDEQIGNDFELSLPYTLYKNGAYLTSGTSTIYSDIYPVGGYHGHTFTDNYSYSNCYIAVEYNGMIIKSDYIKVTVAGKDTKKYLSIRYPQTTSISTNHVTGTYDVVVRFEVYDPNSSDSTYPSEMERIYNLPFGESSYAVNLSYTDYYYNVEYEIIYEGDPYMIYV